MKKKVKKKVKKAVRGARSLNVAVGKFARVVSDVSATVERDWAKATKKTKKRR